MRVVTTGRSRHVWISALCALLGGLLSSSCAGIPPIAAPSTPESARIRLAELTRTLPPRPAEGGALDEWCNAQLYLRKARVMLAVYENSDILMDCVSRELRNAEESLDRVRAGRGAPLLTGNREEGYYCDNDASFQPFVRYLPAAARRGKPLPMLVFLHGYCADYNVVNWQGCIPLNLIAFAEREGYCIAAPFGRGNTDFQGIGEQDVLNVMAEMKRRYQVDENRIILAGYSMGATGGWTLGAHYPDQFAGLFLVSGRGDYYFWHKTPRESLPVYKRRLIDAEFAGSLTGNLRSIPIFCAHGARDDLVPVEEARTIVKAVRAVNPGLIYVEPPDADHGVWEAIFESRQVASWINRCRRNPVLPAGYQAGHPRYNRAGVTNAPPACGPVKDAFLSPFVFVLAGDPADAGLQARFTRAATDWFRFSKAMPRLSTEKTATPEQLASCNVFLFGEPENSALIRKVLADSPVTVKGDRYIAGAKSFPRSGNGLYLVRPSPWNPAKRAVVQAGIPWGDRLPENHKYDILPDYIVYSSTTYDDDDSNTALAAGFFDAQGRIAD